MAIGVSLVAFAVYLRTLARTLPIGDSGDLITASWVMGIPHPPGYPLIAFLGHWMAALPVGSPAFRINLLSAILNSMAVGLSAMLISRMLDDGGRDSSFSRFQVAAASATGALALAFSRTFWTYSLVAEVFALNDFFALLLLYLLTEWVLRPSKPGLFRLFALCCGLAATNQQTIVLLAPAFLVLLWAGRRRLQRKELSIAALLLIAGLLPYLYLPWAALRKPVVNWGDPATLDRFIALVTRAEYGTFRLAAGGHARGSPFDQLQLLTGSILSAFTWACAILAAVGAYWLYRHRGARGKALAMAFAITGPLFVMFANPAIDDARWKGILERFYILPELIVGVWVGVGALRLSLWLQQRFRLAAALPLLLPLALLPIHWRAVDQRDNSIDEDYGRDILGPLEPNALVLMRGDAPTLSIDYLQFAEGMRPDVVKIDTAKLTRVWYVQEIRRRYPDIEIPFEVYDEANSASMVALLSANIIKRPVYLYGAIPGANLESTFDQLRAGLVVKLEPKGAGQDEWAAYRKKIDWVVRFHYPVQPLPDESKWERSLQKHYGEVASITAVFLEKEGRGAEAVAMCRLAIRVWPGNSTPYKNLAVLLRDQGGDRTEIVALLNRYLQLEPNAPDAEAVRAELSAH